MTRPLFATSPAPVELSAGLSGPQYRASRGESVSWTAIKLKTVRPCQECAYRQHELRGATGPRRGAKHRRKTASGACLELCSAHAELWRDRDATDSGVPRSQGRRRHGR